MMTAQEKAAARARFEASQRRVAHWVADVRAASATEAAHVAGPSRVPKISRTRTRYDPRYYARGHDDSDAREPSSLCQRRRAPQPLPIVVPQSLPPVVPPPPPPFFASSAGSMSTEEDTMSTPETIRTPEPLPGAARGLSPHIPHSSPMRMSPPPLSSAHAPIPLFMSASTPPSSLSPSPSPQKAPVCMEEEHDARTDKVPMLSSPSLRPTSSPLMRPSHCALPSIRKSRRSPLVAISPPTTEFRF